MLRFLKIIASHKLMTVLLPFFFFCLMTSAAFAINRPVKATPDEIKLAGTIQEKLAWIKAKEKELADKEEELKALGKEIDEKLPKLMALQDSVKQKLDELNAIKNKRFKKLVGIYNTMSASKLAPLLDKMADETVADILRAMKPANVAKVMPKMDKDKAVRVSRIMGLMK